MLRVPRWAYLFLRQNTSRQRLILEATFYLLAARVALKIVPFRKISAFLRRPIKEDRISNDKKEKLETEVNWAIRLAAKNLPGETVCFPRAIAAQKMLRRHGIRATLYYGARTVSEQGLEAHVWLQDGEKGIIGYQTNHEYKVLARYQPL